MVRAEPKGKRKLGRCLRWARPAMHKKSDAKKVFKLGEYAGTWKARRKKRRKISVKE
jgi:hypothetical protein